VACIVNRTGITLIRPLSVEGSMAIHAGFSRLIFKCKGRHSYQKIGGLTAIYRILNLEVTVTLRP